MATEKQRRWRAEFARRYGGGKKRSRSKGGTHMARKKGRKGSSGGRWGIGRILTPKNAIMTVGAAVVAPRLGVSSSIGGAVGGYLGAGPMGALAGFLLGGPAANMLSGFTGGATTGSTLVY